MLTGEWGIDRIGLPAAADDRLGVEWELGVAAAGLDVAARSLSLADGRSLAYDGLIVATGASPRRLPGTDGLSGVHTLRTVDDVLAIRRELDAGARRVVVVGAGFIGAEVAASCRTLGLDVTIVEPLPQPLARVLGDRVGSVIASLHRTNGVDVRLGIGVDAVEGEGSVERVVLTDGSSVDADLVVVGIGVVPNTSWLEGSGLTVDNGVLCDETTLAAPGVVAAGDVARWPNRLFDEVMRVEHWENALDMAAHAARRLLAEGRGEDPSGYVYSPVPWFWSDQYDRKLQLAGRPRPTDDLVVVAGGLDEERFCACYGRDGRATAVIAVNMAGRVVRYRRALADGLSWEQVLADAAGT
ncbi:MAG: FAD-dependent oxidoreductase [Acidimicrobiales bacterium]|nr:FAD-dependent oxidoreductase [Acidimicrobiales bacterium]